MVGAGLHGVDEPRRGTAPASRGHRRPDLPGELGFYDLRVPEMRERQAALARAHGVTAFCWWHYWFAGRRLLERPFDEVLAAARPPSRSACAGRTRAGPGVWHGAPDRVLIEQTYPGARGRPSPLRPPCCRRSPTRATSASTAGRLLTVFRPQELPGRA